MTDLDAVLASYPPGVRERVDAVRALLLGAEPALVESVKWNAPSFALDGVHRATLQVRGQLVRLVLHFDTARPERKGAPPLLADDRGLVQWASDIRGIVTPGGLEEIAARRDDLLAVLRAWLALR